MRLTPKQQRWMYVLLWCGLIFLYVIVPFQHLDSAEWNYDEGPQLQAAMLANRGYALYDEVALNKPPLLTWYLQLAFRIGGMRLEVARFAILLLNLSGFIAFGWLGDLWWGHGAGLWTMGLLLTLPETPVRAVVVMNDLPTLSAALFTFWGASRFRQQQTSHWLIICGIAYACVFAFHPLFSFILLPILIIILYPRPGVSWSNALNYRGLFQKLIYFALSATFILLLIMLNTDLQGVIHWVYRYNAITVDPRIFPSNWNTGALIGQYLLEHTPIVIVGIGGVLILISSKHQFWCNSTLVWFFTTLLVLYLNSPLWRHYRIALLYPILLIGGGGIATAIRWLLKPKKHHNPKPVIRWAMLSLLCVGLLTWGIQRATIPLNWPQWTETQIATLEHFRQIADDEFIVSDSPFLVFVSGHAVPPQLADTSYKRILTQHLSVGEIVKHIFAYNVRVVAFDNSRFHQLRGFKTAIKHIARPPTCFEEMCIYEIAPPQLSEFTLDKAFQLYGYTLSERVLIPGQNLEVVLVWESLTDMTSDITVFVHLVDAEGNMVAQHDGPPLLGELPTSAWSSGNIVPDPHIIMLPDDLPPGIYQLWVGMYHWPSLERLPVVDANGKRNISHCIELVNLTVQGRQ